MKKWVTEDWEFELTVIEGVAEHCRLGLETGDKFVFSYGCPEGMCPKVMMDIFTWCEVIRCGGDLIHRGEKEKYEMNVRCKDTNILFHFKATLLNRDESGKPVPNDPRPLD